MKRLLSASLLVIMLGACIARPVCAQLPSKIEKESNVGAAFTAGLITGAVPVAGTAFSLLMFGIAGDEFKINAETISFLAGHALGVSFWAYPWYLLIKGLNREK